MSSTNEKTLEVSIPIQARFLYEKRSSESLILVLHGYAQTAEIILNQIRGALPEDASILAIEAPFPVPIRKDVGYKVGYAWYFFDVQTQKHLIEVSVPRNYVRDILTSLGLMSQVTVVIGYSQGGYLAPHVASILPQVKRVIGVACQFVVPRLPKNLSFQMDAIHADQDEYVEFKKAQDFHNELLRSGVSGRFVALKNHDHMVTEEMVAALKSLIES